MRHDRYVILTLLYDILRYVMYDIVSIDRIDVSIVSYYVVFCLLKWDPPSKRWYLFSHTMCVGLIERSYLNYYY